MKHRQNATDKLLLKAGKGRIYNCGTMTAVFKADENETEPTKNSGLLNFFIPGDFERNMPSIVKWFEDNK